MQRLVTIIPGTAYAILPRHTAGVGNRVRGGEDAFAVGGMVGLSAFWSPCPS